MASFSDPLRIMDYQGLLLKPLGFTFDGYKAVFRTRGLYTGYVNTLIYLTAGTSVNMVMTTLGAYALAQRGFMLRKAFMLMIVFTMYFSGGMIPNFILIRNLHMLNTRWALIIPGAIGTWNMLILRTAFRAVPRGLTDAAIIDGANDMVILLKIFVPVSKATLAVIFLFYAVGHWNSWFNAMIYLPRAQNLYPLQLHLREVLIASNQAEMDVSAVDFTRELIKYCTTIVASVPILCIYPFLQRYFVKGVMMGSLKE
ncbi:MAG: carbohydrate ABC transporter permease [Treponema sp.]|jgi:putative aldouronate transport system permease protein|nr:carbohydrate ABC transporter permease [Treponema sp.]